MLTRVTGGAGDRDVELPGSWRLKLKAPLSRYDLSVAHDPLLDGLTLEARAGPQWLRLVTDLTADLADGGRFRIDLHLQQLGPAQVEWVALLREDKGDQRFHARPSNKIAGSGRVSLSASVDPPEPGTSYVLAISLGSFPARITASAVTCTRLDASLEEGVVRAVPDRATLARAVQAYLWDDYYTAAHGLPRDLAPGAIVAHFLRDTSPDLRPNPMFHAPFYRRQLAERGMEAVPQEEGAFLHWLRIGRPLGLVPTALFDEEEYRALNAVPVAIDAYDHFLTDGFRRNFSPSQFFDARWYVRRYGVDETVPAIVHYATVGARAGLAPAPDIPGLPKGGPTLDQLAADLRLRAAALPADQIAKAALIEPQIMRPLGPRRLTLAPLKHSSARPARAGARVAAHLAGQRFPNLVLVPQVRLAGSARVAGALADALGALLPDEPTLVVATERADFERADWFPASATQLNLPALLGADLPDDMVPLLLDLARGLGARRLFNVNSPSGWNLLARHGRQLAERTALYSYLFTWDLDRAGTRTGYPISALPSSFDRMDAVLLDNRRLADELAQRYALSADAAARRLSVLWSPGEPADEDWHDRFGSRGNGRVRCLWAGRFDRQKRLDLVLALAALRPDLDIHVYGKPVLGDMAVDLADLPANVTLRGVFTSLEELDLGSFDLFLYTAAWDGLPTILIDMAARGLAVAASAVGGVVDLIDGATGWPVAEWDEPAAYARTIDAMQARPDEVHRRAARLRDRARARHAPDAYRQTLAAVLARDGRA